MGQEGVIRRGKKGGRITLGNIRSVDKVEGIRFFKDGRFLTPFEARLLVDLNYLRDGQRHTQGLNTMRSSTRSLLPSSSYFAK